MCARTAGGDGIQLKSSAYIFFMVATKGKMFNALAELSVLSHFHDSFRAAGWVQKGR